MSDESDNALPDSLPAPEERARLFEEALREADRHKWIESEKAGYDVGERAVQDWHANYWRCWCRERWIEHLRGERFWVELDKGDYGLLKRKFHENWELAELIVERIKEGGENLDIIQWATEKGYDTETVIEVLKTMDINSRRLAPPEPYLEDDEPVAEESTLATRNARALVVDDDPDTRVLLEELLLGEGLEVTCVGSGEEAIEEVGRRRFHAYLIDIMLPGKHGAEVAWHLRRHGINSPIIAISAVLDRWSEEDLYDCGFTGLMAKPFDLNALREFAREVLRDTANQQTEADESPS